MLGLFDSVYTDLLKARELNNVRLLRVKNMMVCGGRTIRMLNLEALQLLALYTA